MKDEGDEKKTKFGGEMRKKLSLVENKGFVIFTFVLAQVPPVPAPVCTYSFSIL